MISLDLHDSSLAEQIRTEWLETNGLGGYAGSTIVGCNTRRYHGLLVAATKPPTERMVLVSKLDETLLKDGQRFELGTNDYGGVTHPKGYRYLQSFKKDLHPEFLYAVHDIVLKKSVLMIRDENTTIITYEVKEGESFTLELLPLLAGRGYHQLIRQNNSHNQQVEASGESIRLKLYENTPDLYIGFAGGQFHENRDWYFNLNYSLEEYRGLDYKEDLFTPGNITFQIQKGEVFHVVLTLNEHSIKDPKALVEKELKRRQTLVEEETNLFVRQLVLAADQFIVRRDIQLSSKHLVSPEGHNLQGTSIIAGYHWFTDWGRDTMIALPGLCLATKRFEDAKKILIAFAQSVDKGMLPNRFRDNGEAPEYNNVDGTLHYFIAIYEYLRATGDKEFVLKELLPVLKDIIDWHYRGTRFNIHVDEDGLLYSGEKGLQLTWMDAKIGEWVVTPRIGRPVEIQALWYNALRIFSELLAMNGQKKDSDHIAEQAIRIKQIFTDLFWFEEGNYLYDVIDETGNPDTSLRPNQVFAISLPFPLVEGTKAKLIMRIVEEKLYTSKGLRSLSPDDERYAPVYGGNQLRRDAAYHQGTVWSWLIGPYVDAIFKTNGSFEALAKANKVVTYVLPHLNEAGIGTVSEIFDAEAPHTPRGCISQAWSVGELLRVMVKYDLFETGP